MSVQVNISDVIPCIYRFLAKNGFNEAAKAIKGKCDIDGKGGLSNIKLLKICKFYLKHHPELVKPEEEEEEEEEEETPKVTKGKANGVQNGKRAAKKQVEEEEEEEEEEKPATKKKVKTEAASTKSKKASKKMEEEEEEEEEEEKPTTKKGKTEASSTKQRKASKQEEEDEEEEEEVKPKSKKQSEPAIKEKSASTSALNNRKSSKTIEEEEEEEIVPQKHTGRFSYVDVSLYEDLPDHSKDMRFEAKSIFGNGGDAFGAFGNERLKDTRGKGFTKEKNKLKNKQFHGGSGRIDAFAKNSIKFDDE